MVEAWDIFWLAIALGCAFLATFLANLWLAPYRIMNERLNVIANTQKNAEPVDEEVEQRGRLHVKREVLRREMEDLRRLCFKPDVGVSQIRTTTVLSSCFCVGQTVL